VCSKTPRRRRAASPRRACRAARRCGAAPVTPVPADPAWHFSYSAFGFEAITITDFHGVMSAGETQGYVRGSDGETSTFDTDMRFMRGTYAGMDGRAREGAFGFI